jgi:hypothetical protein
MNPARSLPASAVVELWALSASAANLSSRGRGKSRRRNYDRLRCGRVPPDPRPTCAPSRRYWISGSRIRIGFYHDQIRKRSVQARYSRNLIPR